MSAWWDWDGPLCDYSTPNDAITHAPTRWDWDDHNDEQHDEDDQEHEDDE